MGLSLYRRYRPQKFAEVAGQDAAISVIVKSLEHSSVGHAYMFSGPRGCGKTTVARLLAKALNCLAPVNGYEPCCQCRNCQAIAAGESLDVIEIDGASNNSVDEVRELKSNITLAPFSSKYKIYIIDEVHMLSISAFNALLKTLEEPPDYVVFVLATTEAHKVPVTIRSRCQHIPFHRIGTKQICQRLLDVCASEKIKAQPEALWEISRQADGALRDALSMLEQVSNLGKELLALADVETTLGQGSRLSLERWLASWRNGNMDTFKELEQIFMMGASPQRFLEELFSLVRDLWLTAKWSAIVPTLDISDQEREYLKTEAPLWRPDELASCMSFLADLLPQSRMGLRMDVLIGLLMAKMSALTSQGQEIQKTQTARPQLPVSKVEQPLSPPVQNDELLQPSVDPVVKTEQPSAAPDPVMLPEASAAAESLTPIAPERWQHVLETLCEHEFVLYCALIGALPSMADGQVVLEIPNHYAYEFLRIDRNCTKLSAVFGDLLNSNALVLRHGALRSQCGAARDGTGDGNVRQSEEIPALSAAEFKQAENSEPKKNDLRPQNSAGAKEENGVPFENMVQDVKRWLRSDVVVVRQSGEVDTDAAEGHLEQ